jgi:hypothetical protein
MGSAEERAMRRNYVDDIGPSPVFYPPIWNRNPTNHETRTKNDRGDARRLPRA